jgi:hypothetical protein
MCLVLRESHPLFLQDVIERLPSPLQGETVFFINAFGDEA